MATLDEIKLAQLLQPFEGPGGIASLNPLAFQYQDQFYPNQMQYQYPPRTDISPTQDFYQLNSISPTQDFYQPRTDISPTQDFYQPRTDISPTQDFYQPREFVNAPGAINYYQPDLTTLRGLDMNRFQDVSDMSMIDETTDDEQDQEYIDQVEKSNNPLKGIMDLLRNIPTPFNLVRRGLEALRGSESLSDFRNSRTGAEFFKRRRDREALARDPNVFRDARDITSRIQRDAGRNDRPDRNRSSVTRSSAARSRGVGGGGYTASDSNRESYRGR